MKELFNKIIGKVGDFLSAIAVLSLRTIPGALIGVGLGNIVACLINGISFSIPATIVHFMFILLFVYLSKYVLDLLMNNLPDDRRKSIDKIIAVFDNVYTGIRYALSLIMIVTLSINADAFAGLFVEICEEFI